MALIENGYEENDTIQKLDDYYKLRIIVDFVSGMTDQFALNHYQKLSGQKIIWYRRICGELEVLFLWLSHKHRRSWGDKVNKYIEWANSGIYI